MGSLAATEMVEVEVEPVPPGKLLELRRALLIKAAMVVQVHHHLYQAQLSSMQVEVEEPDIKTLPPELVEVELAGVV